MIARIKNFGPLRLCGKYFSRRGRENDYATHVPILIGLARMREIKNVLEFGCGHYSTLTFLNRAAFPHLVKLHSIENDSSWSETIRELPGTTRAGRFVSWKAT
jgi:predicted O-methyltransferase YrrM